MKKIDMGKYVLLLGKNAPELFDFYKVEEMHGLNRKDAQAEEIDKTVGNGVYIYGLTNYDPHDKKLTGKAPYKPFLFLNMSTFDKLPLTKKCTTIMHECVHLALLLFDWNVDDKEEDITSMAEDEANKIIEKMGLDKKEQPKKGFFSK